MARFCQELKENLAKDRALLGFSYRHLPPLTRSTKAGLYVFARGILLDDAVSGDFRVPQSPQEFFLPTGFFIAAPVLFC